MECIKHNVLVFRLNLSKLLFHKYPGTLTVNCVGQCALFFQNWSPNQTLLWTCGPAWLGLNTTGLFGSFGYVFRRPCDGEDLKLSPRFASMEAANKIPKQTLKRFAHLSEILDNNLSSIIQKRADAGYGLGVCTWTSLLCLYALSSVVNCVYF